MVYSDKLIGCGGYMKIRLLLIDEERVRYPDVLDEL